MQRPVGGSGASPRAATDASGASGRLTGVPRPLRLRARTGGRPGQRREAWRHGHAWSPAQGAACRSRGAGQGRGVLACLLRWPIRRRDGRLGRHQHGLVRLDEQRGERELRPGRGSRRGSVSAVGSSEARWVHRWRGKRPRAIMYDMKALCPVGLRSECPPCSPALAGSGAQVQMVHGGARRHAAAPGRGAGI